MVALGAEASTATVDKEVVVDRAAAASSGSGSGSGSGSEWQRGHSGQAKVGEPGVGVVVIDADVGTKRTPAHAQEAAGAERPTGGVARAIMAGAVVVADAV